MKILLLIDANSLIHRCFHALPPFQSKEGRPTGALYGLANIIIKILRERKPEYVAACFDRPEPTFRKQTYDDYKIHRPKAPDELVEQLIEAHTLMETFGMKPLEIPGFEADDIIGTLIEKFKNLPDLNIIVLSADADMFQLVENSRVVVESLKKGISETMIYDKKAVEEKFGVPPEQLTEYKGLVGDTSDNIPGAKGIGPKTAQMIIKNFGSLENYFENGGEDKNYEKINSQKDSVMLSRELATIRRDVPVAITSIEELTDHRLDLEKIKPYFEKLGFQSLIKRLDNNQR